MSQYEKRRDKLRRALRKQQLPAILISDVHNVTYLTGFTGDSSYLLVTQEKDLVLSDTRYTVQLAEECPQLDVVIRRSGTGMVELLAKNFQPMKLSQLGFEAASMSIAEFGVLNKAMSKTEWVATTGMVERLREIKDRGEVSAIRESIRIAEKTFAVIRASLQLDQTEREVAHALEHQIRRFGGAGCSFSPIVAVGPRAALPHAVPGDSEIGDSGFVLVDWGAEANLYMSDLTRILVTGKISTKLERIYGVVFRAQQQAIKAIRAGVTMQDVDAAARRVITKAGYGEAFGHGLGHGIGLQIHEDPRLAANEERPLQAGMVVTIEPGIYLPKWGGVRIEDDVLVTKDGCEVLSSVTKDLHECVVG